MRMQFKASRSGARSGSGKEGWFFRVVRREVIDNSNVSKFPKA